MACLSPESDDERDRVGGQATGEPVGSAFDRRKCTRRSGQRVGRQAAGGATHVCQLRGTLGRPRQAEAKDASHDGKRGGAGKNLRNLSKMRGRLFPPWMRNWACSQEV